MPGALRAIVGFGIQQAMQIAGNQPVGFISEEWREIKGRSIRNMVNGLGIIMLSILALVNASS